MEPDIDSICARLTELEAERGTLNKQLGTSAVATGSRKSSRPRRLVINSRFERGEDHTVRSAVCRSIGRLSIAMGQSQYGQIRLLSMFPSQAQRVGDDRDGT
jgi:hypothetical protein